MRVGFRTLKKKKLRINLREYNLIVKKELVS